MRRRVLDYYRRTPRERGAGLKPLISCGSISLAGFGFIVLFAVIGIAVHGDTYAAAAWGVFALVFSAAGTITALWGVVFGSRHRRLAAIGLLLNAAVLIWILRGIVSGL